VAEIKLSNNKKVFFTVLYRSPSQSSAELKEFIKNLEKNMIAINNENPSLVILTGDFNARSTLLWGDETTENEAGKLIADFSNVNLLEQLIDEPTHLPRDDIATCIDLIFTSDRYAFIDSGVIPSEDPFCKHQIITGKVDFNIPSPPKTKRKVWEYDKSNFRGLRNELTLTNWDLCFSDLHPNEMATLLTEKLHEFADRNIPSKVITINDRE
jgi:hypothetical protein